MNTLYARCRRLTLSMAALVASCAVAPIIGEAGSAVPETFSLRDVYSECNRLGCREPNRVVARYFSTIVKNTGKGCIVHVAPQHGETPWQYWDEYVQPMHMLLVGSRLRLYAYVPAGHDGAQLEAKARQTLGQVKGLYEQHGAEGSAVSMQLVNDPSAVVPPYREPYCRDRPILEIVEGARVLSPAASLSAEHVVIGDRAARTVLVVVDTWNDE